MKKLQNDCFRPFFMIDISFFSLYFEKWTDYFIPK